MEAAPLNLDGCQSRQVTCKTVRKYNRMLTVDQRSYLNVLAYRSRRSLRQEAQAHYAASTFGSKYRLTYFPRTRIY